MCHIGLLFPHNGPVFHKCPRLISKDLIAPRHQSGDIGNTAAFIGINEKAASLGAKYRPDTREIRTEYRQLGWLVSTASGQARHPVGPILAGLPQANGHGDDPGIDGGLPVIRRKMFHPGDNSFGMVLAAVPQDGAECLPLTLLVFLVWWLAITSVGFGLFAQPPNPTVVVTLALEAIAVFSAIFIILEMYRPIQGSVEHCADPNSGRAECDGMLKHADSWYWHRQMSGV